MVDPDEGEGAGETPAPGTDEHPITPGDRVDRVDPEDPDESPGPDGSASPGPPDDHAEADAPEVHRPSPPWSQPTKLVMAVVLAAAAGWVLYVGRNVLTIAALAGLIAYLVAPLIRLAHTRLHVPRALALLGSYLIVFLGVLGVGALVATGLFTAVSELDVDEAEESLRTTAVDVLEAVEEFTLFGYTIDLSESVEPLLEWLEEREEEADREAAAAAADEDDRRVTLSSSQVDTIFGGLTTGFAAVGSALLAALVSAIVTVLVAIYLNADSGKFHRGLHSAVPPDYRGDADNMSHRIARIWRGYLYGQLLNSAITGFMVWVVLWAVGLPGAFVFAVLLGLLNMIPTFGPIIAAVPAVLAALTLGSTRLDWSRPAFALLVVGIYLLVVQLQANLIAPYITGRAVRLSPATVLLGLMVGVQFGGLIGAVLVVPVIATGKELGRYVMAKLTDQDPYPDDETEDGSIAATLSH